MDWVPQEQLSVLLSLQCEGQQLCGLGWEAATLGSAYHR